MFKWIGIALLALAANVALFYLAMMIPLPTEPPRKEVNDNGR